MIAGTIEYVLKLRNELSRQLGDASKDLKKVGDDFQDVGKMATVGLTVPIVGAGVAALKFATDFNASMANVASLIPGNTARVVELKDAVQAMAVDTGKSTDDLAGGLYQVISAFGDTNESVKILETNARAAAAGVATTTDAINLTSAVTKGYGDTSAAAVQQAADLALMTVRLGQTTFPELASSIGRVTPLTAELGVKQTELFGVMATFTGVTGGAAEVSTQLRGVLQALLSPTDTMTGLFKELGVESGKALIEQRGLQGAMDAIVTASKNGGGQLKDYIGSIEGQTIALSASGAQSKALTEKMAAMQHVAGTTAAAFKEQTAGVNAGGHAWDQFKQKIATTAQDLGDALLPILVKVGGALAPVLDIVLRGVQLFGQLPAPVQAVIVVLAGLAAAIGPVLVVLGTLISSTATLATSGVFMAIAGGIGSVGAAALAAAPQLAAFAVAAASVAAIGSAVRNAVGLYNDRIEQNRLVSEQAKSHQLALAEASRVAGHAITDVAEATNILREHNAALRTEQQAQAAAQEAALQQTRQHAPAIQAMTEALAAAKAEMAALTPYQRENIAAGLKLGMSIEDVAKAVRASEPAVRLYKERLEELESTAKRTEEAQRKFLASVSNAPAMAFGPFAAAVHDAGDELQNIAAGLEGNGTLVTMTADEYAAATAEALKWAQANGAVLAPSLRDSAADIKEAKEATEGWGKTITDVIGRIPSLVQAGLTGGGGLGGAMKGIASAFGEAGIGKLFSANGAVGKALGGGLTKLLGDTVGGAMAAALPGIGAALGSLVGPLIGKLGSLFGVSQEIKDARAAVDQFEASIAKSLTSQQKAEAGGEKWKQTVIGVRDAYLAVGGTAAQAEAIVRQLWDTDHPDRAKAAMEEINRVLQQHKDLLAATADESAVDVNKMREVAQKYGVDLASLGPKYQEARLREAFATTFADMQLLIKGGADVGGVLVGMQDEIQQLVTDSMKFGVAIPANMQPYIAELIRAGLLVDANGQKLTAVSQLNFADPIVSALDRVVGALQSVADRVAAAVVPAINSIPRDVTVNVGVNYNDPGFTPDINYDNGRGDNREGYAAGTIGMTGSWFRDFGPGRQVTLHGREAVVREDQAGAFAAATGGGGNGAALERVERLLRDQPRAIALAIINAQALGGTA